MEEFNFTEIQRIIIDIEAIKQRVSQEYEKIMLDWQKPRTKLMTYALNHIHTAKINLDEAINYLLKIKEKK